MKAIFPGSFDLIHEGHTNIIKKASQLFETLYIVVSNNLDKKQQYNIKQREEKVKKICKTLNTNIIVIRNETKLTSQLAQKLDVNYIVRGLRNNNDLKYEMEIAFANKKLNHNLETIFFIADYGLEKISNSLIHQINQLQENKNNS